MRKLKQRSYTMQWGTYKGYTFYLSATSSKQIIEMMAKIGINVSANEIKNFFMAWGTNHPMAGVEITGPCIYAVKGMKWGDKKELTSERLV